VIRLTLLALALTIFLPPSIYTVLGTSSMSTGLLPVMFLWTVIGLTSAPTPYRLRMSDGYVLCAAMAIIAIMFVHLLIESTKVHGADFGRFFSSSVILVIMVMGADFAARNLIREPGENLVRAANYILIFMTGMGLAARAGFPSFGAQASAKAIILFAEPSHFGLAFLPILLFRASLASKSGQVRLLGGALVLGAILQSLTTLAGVALLAVTLLRRTPLFGMLFVMILVGSGVALLDLSYYADRLSLSGDSDNLTTLVYLQGWENAWLNFGETDGIGVGFQQFGLAGSTGAISEKIYAILGGTYINLMDGGSTATKLIAEFGVFGIVMLLVYFRFALRSLMYMRGLQTAAAEKRDIHWMFFSACTVSYSLELVLRGVGYFSTGGFLALTALMALYRLRRADTQSGPANPVRTVPPGDPAWSRGS
jgi:hypothetical protein